MTDILVIGGGVAGLSAAAHCAMLGKVTVIESERGIGYHASGRSAAMYEPTYGKPSSTALARASHDFFFADDARLLTPRGVLLVADDAQAQTFKDDLNTMNMREIAIAEAQQLLPVLNPATTTRAAYHAEAWDIDTHEMLQMFHRQVQENGGEVLTNCAATQINRTRMGWEVRTTTQGVIGAKLLINAAGAWADQLALMARIPPLGLQPLRRSMARVKAPEGHDISAWPMVFGAGESWYAKPDAGALIISPAEEDPAEAHDAFADDMVLAEGIARYEHHMTTPVTRMLANWAGLRTFAPDRQLVLGRSPHDPAYIWCAAQGGYGFQTAPAAGQLIAEVIAEKPPSIEGAIAAELSPARFS